MSDSHEELVRLKDYLHRLRKVCELHRKLGEDTEFEIRELRRKITITKEKFSAFSKYYDQLILQPNSDECAGLCNTAFQQLKTAILEL